MGIERAGERREGGSAGGGDHRWLGEEGELVGET